MSDKIKDVEIRQATAEDIKLFYPNGSPRTVYAWLALYKGVPACLAGLIIDRRASCVAFSEVKEVDASKLTRWRTAQVLFAHIRALNMPMFAACEASDKNAQRFVERLGFKRYCPYKGAEIYTWPTWGY